MLNQDLSRVNSFANEKSVVVDTTWQTYSNKSWLWTWWKLISFFKQEADAVLSEDQVLNWYYYSRKKGIVKLDKDLVKAKARNAADKKTFTDPIWADKRVFLEREEEQDNRFDFISRKNKVIKNNKTRLFWEIKHFWEIEKDHVDYELFLFYVDAWYITELEVREQILKFVEQKSQSIFRRISNAFNGQYNIRWMKFSEFLKTEEKHILAYWARNGSLTSGKLEELDMILKKELDHDGDKWLEYLTVYYKEDMVEEYLEKMWL